MIDSTNICLSCGLCCEGAVIGFVQVGREELPFLLDVIDIENTNGDGFFLQPCKKYCDGCTIYARRPKQCAKFECGVLKSLDQKEIDFESALDIIQEVRHRTTDIERKVSLLQIELQSQSFYFKMTELKKLLQRNGTEVITTQNHLDLLEDLEQLDTLLSSKFDVQLF